MRSWKIGYIDPLRLRVKVLNMLDLCAHKGLMQAFSCHHAKEGAPKKGLKRLSTTCKDPPQRAGDKKEVMCQRL